MRWRYVVGAVSLLAAVAGCGGGERTFTVDEFIEEANAEGAGLALGPAITTNDDGVEVRSVTLTGEALSPTGSVRDEAGEPEGGGAMLALGSAEEAGEELDRCESAPAFTCFRAANVVLRFEGLFPEEQARISVALQALATE